MALRVKFKTQFPANVTVSSPLTLTKTGLSYAFGLSIDDLRLSLDPIYASQGRLRLTADKTFYADNAKADDTGDGLTALTAKKTIQAVVDLVAHNYDLAGYQVVCQLAAGTYSSAGRVVLLIGPLTGANPRGTTFPSASVVPFLIRGDTTSAVTAANYIITSTAANAIVADAGGYIGVEGVKINSTTGDCIRTGMGSFILHGAVIFGTAGAAKRHASNGSTIESYANWWQDGNCTYVHHVDLGGRIFDGTQTETLLSNCTYTAYIRAYDSGSAASITGMTFTPGAFTYTGKRFDIDNGGTVYTGTSGNRNYFPGTIAGTTNGLGGYDGTNFNGVVYDTWTVRWEDDGATIGPQLSLFRFSTTPAGNDFGGYISYYGRNSAATFKEYGRIGSQFLDVTSGSEDAILSVQTIVAGTLADRVIFGQGVQVGAPTGGDKGSGTVNAAAGFFDNGGTRLGLSKVITITRDLTTATGSVAYTGAGFKPTSLRASGGVPATLNYVCVAGYCDSALGQGTTGMDTGRFGNAAVFIRSHANTFADMQAGTVTSLDSDGFTISWVKTGSPTGTATYYVLCES